MNETLVEIIDKSQKSIYKISKETGIPYTTLNELYNGKVSVNKVATETAYRLAVYLDMALDAILNKVSLMDGYSGKYKGYSFKWNQEEDGIGLYVKQEKGYILIHKEKDIYFRGNINSDKRLITEVILDAYDIEKQAEKELWEHTI